MTTSTTSPPATELPRDAAGTSVAEELSARRWMVLAVGVGAAVSISTGIYGRVHEPTGQTIATFGFPTLLAAKSWLATAVAVLVVVQVVSASWMWGRLPRFGGAPRWLGAAHRWSGTVAFVLTLPVAYHCLWALGAATTTPRVAVHSALGCFFYGAFATKLLLLRSRHRSPWTLPVAGGAIATALVGIWFTSSFWFFTTVGFPGL